MLRFSVNEAKSQFFDRLKVIEQLDRVALRGLSRFGAFVRRTAKSSIRKARQKRISQLSARELLIYNIRKTEAKRDGRPLPRRPLASSEPGEPPRSITGLLRRFIYFAYDAAARSVVIGPVRIGGKSGTAPRTLEEGGYAKVRGHRTRIDARPYMAPAFAKELPNLPRLLRDGA